MNRHFQEQRQSQLLDIKEKAYTLVLLDLMLPGASGEEVLKEIRKAETKSEAEAETEAETEVIIKAGIQEGQGSGRLEFRDMVLIRSTFEVSIGGRVLPKITKQEFAILEFFA